MKGPRGHLDAALLCAGESIHSPHVRRTIVIAAIEAAVAEERARCSAIVRSWLSEFDWEAFEEIAQKIERGNNSEIG